VPLQGHWAGRDTAGQPPEAATAGPPCPGRRRGTTRGLPGRGRI